MDQQTILLLNRAFNAGHFWSPEALQHGGVFDQKDLKNLTPDSLQVQTALRSLSHSEGVVYENNVHQIYNRQPDYDGVIGPALIGLLSTSRCMVPDYAPPVGTAFSFEDDNIQKVAERMQLNTVMKATGSGNWPRCHGVGDFHAALVRVDLRRLPSFLNPVFSDVLKRVRTAYAGIGLRFDFIDQGKNSLTDSPIPDGDVNIEFSFVSSSSGWIGLAIVGQGENCRSNIWCKYLATYRGGNSPESIAQQWTTLIKHELGHNCGLDHSHGGVMNPSIISGLSPAWTNDDPSTPKLKSKYGGVPVPIDTPPDDPTPPTDIESLKRRVDSLESNMLAQQGFNAYLLDVIKELKQ